MTTPEPGINSWAQSMEQQMEGQREALRVRDPLIVADNSGASWEKTEAEAGTLTLKFIDTPLRIEVPEYRVILPSGDEAPVMIQGLVTAYLVTAKGVPRAHQWIVFRELPNGLFYHQAFDGYTGGPLVRGLKDDLEAFRRGAKAVGGFSLTGFGDAAFEFRPLPHIWMAVVYWLGDEEDGFPSRAQVLFDRSAGSYLITDGLAILGSQLARQILRAAAQE